MSEWVIELATPGSANLSSWDPLLALIGVTDTETNIKRLLRYFDSLGKQIPETRTGTDRKQSNSKWRLVSKCNAYNHCMGNNEGIKQLLANHGYCF